MKIRYGFVTNSSSSSFILARKATVDVNKLASFIYKHGSLGTMIQNFEYLSWPDEITDAYENNNPKLEEMIAKYIAEELTNYSVDMELGDWMVSAGKASNETENVIDYFLYNFEGFDSDDFKTTLVW